LLVVVTTQRASSSVEALPGDATGQQIESNDSLEALRAAESQVQTKLDTFATNKMNYQLLLDAQKVASSLNPRGDEAALSPLDLGCLELQLKVLLALVNARDPQYDFRDQRNRPSLSVTPPLPDVDGRRYPNGVDPKVIKDPAARKAYEDAIADNHRRAEKSQRELLLSRGQDYAELAIRYFVRGFPVDSAARKSAFTVIEATIADKALRDALMSDSRPPSNESRSRSNSQ
jgi:hypothetical protein